MIQELWNGNKKLGYKYSNNFTQAMAEAEPEVRNKVIKIFEKVSPPGFDFYS